MTEAPQPSPIVQRRRLRIELRRAREAAGLTQEQTAAALDWSLSKMIRIEKGIVSVTTTDLRAILQLYAAPPERIEELTRLAKAARVKTWWAPYRGLMSKDLAEFVAFEAAASVIRQFEPLLVPGLLQTVDYHRAVYAQMASPEQVGRMEKFIELRTRRQEVLEGPRPPEVRVVLDEAVVRRVAGGRAVMRAQLRRLAELSERPSVRLEIVPFAAGLHAGLRGPFSLFEFPLPEDEDVLFLESRSSDKVIRDGLAEVVAHHEAFARMSAMSLGADGSRALLTRLAHEL